MGKLEQRPRSIEAQESSLMGYIDGQAFPIKEGETILSFVRRVQGKKAIPTLCDAPNLEPFGSCRVCCVDVSRDGNGSARTVASCHTPMTAGLYVSPNSERVKRLRKNIIELVITDHPLECLTCEVNGNCELQDVAARVGFRGVRYPEGESHLDRKKDKSHPYMTSDLSKCINCYRCVRACDEVQGEHVLSMMGRGFDSKIIKGMDVSFGESDCVSCGACAQACPTSAISDVFESKSRKGNEKTRTVCTYCGVGCNLEIAVAGNEIVSIQAPYEAEVNQGHTCLKGRFAFKFYNHPERLREPMIKRNGNFEVVTWDEAYDFIAEKLTKIRKDHGPDAFGGISSARCTNEENYLMQKFVRAVMGTNNIDCCARVCHSPTALGLQRAFGTGAGTNSVEDLKFTDLLLIIGANPTDAHPVTGAKMKQFAMKGKPVIVIDPRRTEIARYASHFLQLRPGTNVAMLNMMLYYIIEEDLVDHEFIKDRCEGYEDFAAGIRKLDVAEMERVTGVDRNLVRAAAIAYASAPNAMEFHGLGVTEHSQGTFTVTQIADLAMITGNIGRRGVGVNPLRGQNNVQGSADMGCQPHQGAGYFDVTNPEYHKRYEEFYGAKLPLHAGKKIPEMFEAAISGEFKALWIMGEDDVQTDPNTHKVIKAMESLELLVVQELFMTETAKYADVILPAASFLEKSGTFTNAERRIQAVHKVVEPIGNSKADGQIMVDIMNRMGYKQEGYDPKVTLEEISQIIPFFAGVKWDELGENGKQWPVAADGSDSVIIHKDSFKRGKGKFHYTDYKPSREIVDHAEEFPYVLTTNRELEHYNCGTMTRRTGNVDILTEDSLMINPADAEKEGLKNGDLVCVTSSRGKVDMKAKVTDQVKPGVLSATFHFPEVMLNLVTSDISDSEAKCPEFKIVSVKIRKTKGIRKHAATAD